MADAGNTTPSLDPLQRHLSDEWHVFTQAPILFTACVLVAAGVIGWLFRHQIGDLKSRLALRDDAIADYKRKLDGATPDQARARIDALEARVSEMEPVRLSDEQISLITNIVRKSPGIVSIPTVMGYPDGAGIVRDLRKALAKAGWQIDTRTLLISLRSASGVLVVVNSIDAEATARGRLVADALAAAEVGIDVNNLGTSAFDAEIVISRPWADPFGAS